MITEWIHRTREIRAALTATITRPPGRGQEWAAEAGSGWWRANGSTEKDAVEALAANVAAFVALYRPPVVITYAGHTAVVSLAASSTPDDPAWSTFITRPDGTGYGSTGRADGWAEAEAHARNNLAHAATDWHDNASVHAGAAFLAGGERFGWGQYGPAEFLRYAAWQRAAKHAIDAGMGDAFHAWAGEHEAEFAVPPAPTA